MTRISMLMGKLCLLSLFGCAVESADPSPDSGSQAGSQKSANGAELQASELLQKVQVGAEEVSFYGNEADGMIMIGSAKPNTLPEFAVEVLEETAGTQLTPLEIFNALAPDGVPHERLVDDHAVRATLLGRLDTAVLQVPFAPQRVEKAWTSSQCDSALTLTGIVVNRQNDISYINQCTSLTPGFPTGSCDVWVETGRHRAGVCNNNPQASALTVAAARHNTSGWREASASVPPNGSYLWTAHPALNSKLTGWVPSKMRMSAIAGFGGGFHARLAPY